ncbi:MAG: tryptophan synthase subunit alpha [Desulfovibrio sp.]|jgi:tryptophan synthase alpha chain|nr:tryptophan synthase subunit alpha [Desulfovibrio sp.]
MEHILTTSIQKAADRGRTALIPFLTAGFPGRERFWTELEALDKGGADIIEIGVPFSDPVADGPVVEAASVKALENGVSLAWILDELKRRRGGFRAPLVLMGYYNPFLQYGLERFAEDAARAGVAGCIVPDLPLDEDAALRAALEAHGMALIPLIGVNTDGERMRAYAQKAKGFAYLVSVLGTTGERSAFPPELDRAFRLAREIFSVPIALGFGIARPEQVAAMPVRPRAVVFGSALLRHIEEGGNASGFMERWADA